MGAGGRSELGFPPLLCSPPPCVASTPRRTPAMGRGAASGTRVGAGRGPAQPLSSLGSQEHLLGDTLSKLCQQGCSILSSLWVGSWKTVMNFQHSLVAENHIYYFSQDPTSPRDQSAPPPGLRSSHPPAGTRLHFQPSLALLWQFPYRGLYRVSKASPFFLISWCGRAHYSPRPLKLV